MQLNNFVKYFYPIVVLQLKEFKCTMVSTIIKIIDLFLFSIVSFINHHSLYTYIFYSTISIYLLIIHVDSEQIMNALFLR